jgi:signal transduction histidine kinase
LVSCSRSVAFSDKPSAHQCLHRGRSLREEIRIPRRWRAVSIAIEKARLYERIVDVEEHLRQNEKLSALGLLAAEVAHEIRNPLTVMKMLYHSLDLKFAPNDPRARDAAIMR